MGRFRIIRLGMVALALIISLSSGGVTGLNAAAPHSAAAASSMAVTAVPNLGVLWVPTGDPGQCGGPQQQWAPISNWTVPIRVDTDNRPGGCRLAFGVQDSDNSLAGLMLFFAWSGPDAGQCGQPNSYSIPISPSFSFSTSVLDDTDNRPGGCNLSFFVFGRSDIGLDIQFWADGDASQCQGSLAPGQFYTAFQGNFITVGLDTDGRAGGCNLALRLRRLTF